MISKPLCRFIVGCIRNTTSSSSSNSSDPLTQPLNNNDGDRSSRSLRVERTKIDGAYGLRIVAFNFDTPLCFLNVDSFRTEIISALDSAHQQSDNEEDEEEKEEERETVLLVNFQKIDFVDESAMSIIEQIVSDIESRPDTVRLYFVACNDEIKEQMRQCTIWKKIGKRFYVDSITRAISFVHQGIVRSSTT